MFDRPLTIVDVETTGGSPFLNRVIEIGLLRIEHGEVVDHFETLLNPECEIPEFITKLTGITDEDLAQAPTFTEVKDELLGYFENTIFVAHNVMFDLSFLREEFRRESYVFNPETLCTVRLSRALYPSEKHHNLSALIERFSFECENRHRAMDDARVLWDFLQLVNTTQAPEVVEKALSKLMNRKAKKEPENELKYEYDEA